MATEELIEAKVGRQNRVVLPAKVRAKLGVEEGSYVGFEIQGDRITLVAIEMRKRLKSVDGLSVALCNRTPSRAEAA